MPYIYHVLTNRSERPDEVSERVPAVPGPGVECDEDALGRERVALPRLYAHARDPFLRGREEVTGCACNIMLQLQLINMCYYDIQDTSAQNNCKFVGPG